MNPDPTPQIIDLESLTFSGNLAFAGREYGEEVRLKAGLDARDTDEVNYLVRIPEGTSTFTPSFFLGLFENSIVTLRAEGFHRKYKFVGEPFTRIVNEGIAEALVHGPVAAA
jgi:hypothetical protein